MSYELQDLSDILDAPKTDGEKTKLLIQQCIQALLYHQIVYSDTKGVSNACLDLYSKHFSFFQAYFDSAGFSFKQYKRYDMFAIVPIGERSEQYVYKKFAKRRNTCSYRTPSDFPNKILTRLDERNG